MAYLVGLSNPDVIRAVAAVEAPLMRAELPETDPLDRLAFYTTLATKSPMSAAVEASTKRLRGQIPGHREDHRRTRSLSYSRGGRLL